MRTSSPAAWMSSSDDEKVEQTLPRVRRDVLTRESKLSLTDTMLLLRARGQRQRDSDSNQTPRESVDSQDREHPWQNPPTRSWTNEGNDKALPSLRHSLGIERPLPLAGAIALPKTRFQEPNACCAEETSSRPTAKLNLRCVNSCNGNQCGTDPEYLRTAQTRPHPSSWLPRNQDVQINLSILSIRRQDQERDSMAGPFQALSTRGTMVGDSYVHRPYADESRYYSVEKQPHSINVPPHGVNDDDVEEKATSPSRDLQTSSDFGFSLADTLTISKTRLRRPVTGRLNEPGGSSTKSRRNGSFDDEEDDDRPCCVGPEFEIREGMTPEEIRAVKKARRKEQCRINQANYRKRKRALEMQTDQEIQQLQHEIDQLRVKRDNTRRRARQVLENEVMARDPMNLVQQVFLQLSPTQDIHRQTRAPKRQVGAVVGLGYEEFVSVEELLAQWKFHRSVFEVFELRLRSVQSHEWGDSLVLSASAILRCSIVSRAHEHHGDDRVDGGIVVCPVVQRFVFDTRERFLAKIISEVDWLAGLREHTTSPLALAAHLVGSSLAL